MPPGRYPPMLVICPLALAGLALGASLSARPWPWLAAAGLCLLAAFRLRGGCRWLLILVAFLAAGVARGSPGDNTSPPSFSGPRLWQVTLSQSAASDPTRPVAARVLAAYPVAPHAGRARAQWRGQQHVRLWVSYWSPRQGPGLRGERWLVRGRLRPPRHGHHGLPRLSVFGAGMRMSRARGWFDRLGQGFDLVVDAARVRVRRGLDRGAPAAQHPLFVALILGDRKQLDDQAREAFVRTGTAHLLAISGLHVGLVAWTLLAAFRWPMGLFLLRLSRPLAAAGWSSRLALGLAVAGAGIYVLLAGSPVSARRALLMIACAALASLLDRGHSAASALATATLCIAWSDPATVFDTALHLSVAAVAGLLLLARRTRPRSGPMRWWRAPLGLVAVSAAAAAATAPICLWAFGRVAVAGLWVNPVVIPLLGSLCLPPLLAGSLLAGLHPPLGEPLLWLAAQPAALGNLLVNWSASPQRSPMLTASLGGAEVIAIYLLAAAISAAVCSRRAAP